VYFFDLDAPGDNNGAFHSSDLRYVFGTLDKSWRPYGERDYQASKELMDSFANFARTGDPMTGGFNVPVWPKPGHGLRTKALHIAPGGTGIGHAPYFRLLINFLTKGDPKA
jgi:para-nitrobenzyl esterase